MVSNHLVRLSLRFLKQLRTWCIDRLDRTTDQRNLAGMQDFCMGNGLVVRELPRIIHGGSSRTAEERVLARLGRVGVKGVA